MTTEENMRLTFLNVRDVFAAHAMEGVLAGLGRSADCSVVARMAYDMADAMMEEREKRSP